MANAPMHRMSSSASTNALHPRPRVRRFLSTCACFRFIIWGKLIMSAQLRVMAHGSTFWCFTDLYDSFGTPLNHASGFKIAQRWEERILESHVFSHSLLLVSSTQSAHWLAIYPMTQMRGVLPKPITVAIIWMVKENGAIVQLNVRQVRYVENTAKQHQPVQIL